MSEHTSSSMWLGRTERVRATVQIWKDVFTPALAQRGTLKDGEELVECISGYLDPRASWEAVATEMAESFPGATIRADEVLDELLDVLDEAAGNERVLADMGAVLRDVRRSLDAVRREAAPVAGGLAESVKDLDGAVTALERLRRTCHLSSDGQTRLYAVSGRPRPNGRP